jgi:hypothetical protein
MTVAQPAPHTSQPASTADGKTGSDDQADSKSKLTTQAMSATIAALVAIAVFVGFSAYLLSQAASASETDWTRIAWVFGTIQSLAAAAAGALWGAAVKQGQVNQADQRASQAAAIADQNREDATKGRALAATLQADAVPAAQATQGGLPQVGADQSEAQAEAQTRLRHAELARGLFGTLVQPPTA